MTLDLLLIETGSGGDLAIQGNDLAIVTGLENQPYLAQFGDDGSWWGNTILGFANDGKDVTFSSTTEAVMNEYALNSNGRQKIQDAMLADLQYLIDDVPDTKITIASQIVSSNRLEVQITINGKLFAYQWMPLSGFLKYSI